MNWLKTVLVTLLLTCIAGSVQAMPVTIIGDERCVSMEQVVDDDEVTWFARTGAGHDLYWQVRDNIPLGAPVVYALGVNDLNPMACVAALADLVDTGAVVYFVTVAPVHNGYAAHKGHAVIDDDVQEFNTIVLANLPHGVAVIDLHTYMTGIDYGVDDGLLFDDETSEQMFAYIRDAIGAHVITMYAIV